MKALEILKGLIKQERYEENTPFYTEDYTKAIAELEAQLKAKDERIKELDCRAYHAEGYISDLHNEYPKHKKFLDKKARSIVAMLFWEWRRCIRECTEADIPYDLVDDSYALCVVKEEIFEKAYTMLKDYK